MKNCRHWKECFAIVCLAAAWLASAETAVDAVTIRRSANGRLWQTVIDASEPLVWRWDDDARSAVLTVTDRTAATVVEYVVARVGDERRGSVALPVPENLSDGIEHLYDLTLQQYSEAENETSGCSARVALLPSSAGAGSVLCNSTDSSDWRRVRSLPRLYAYDADWSGGDASSPDAWFSALSGTSRIDKPLSGCAGYDIVDSSLASALTGKSRAEVMVMTGFGDSQEPFASETLGVGGGGFLFFLH